MNYQDLIHACQEDWDAYINHAFVRQLAQGTLAPPCYLHYLKQDFLFLKQRARAYALAIYKSRTLREMRQMQLMMNTLLDEEIVHHAAYCANWGIDEATLESEQEDVATLAYTRYVLDVGMAGDLVDLYAAFTPCSLGYVVIGQRLINDDSTVLEGNPYRSWIQLYADAQLQADVAREAESFNQMLVDIAIDSPRGQHLLTIFKTAIRMEVAFWQQGLAVQPSA